MPCSCLASVFVLGAITGCSNFSARESIHRFSLVCPDSVRQGDTLSFTVEILNPDGDRALQVTYGWILDWPDVKGVLQKGTAFEPERKEARCSPGTAVLRIYAKNVSNRIVQVLRRDIQVE